MPYQIPALAGKPYRPSNGSEGETFQGRFCARCARFDEQACNGYGDCTVQDEHEHSILARSFWRDLGDPGYPIEWTHDAEGCPTCTAFVSR